ncbi:MAG TPA: hypothetical protein IAC31_05125 [Candidatus Faecousia intestinigallinarum]|nr:hypothetical protein [Candidatus Faecousia intestinigallinarum]
MDIHQETKEAQAFFSAMLKPGTRAETIYNFARKRNTEKSAIACPNGEEHAALQYAAMTYSCASIHLSDALTAQQHETLLILSLMTAMEESSKDSWSYGSKLLYDLRIAGITVTKEELIAFLAQEDNSLLGEGVWQRFCYANEMALFLYAGRLLVRYFWLPDCTAPYTGKPIALPDLRQKHPVSALEELAVTYVPYYIGEQNKAKLTRFLSWLRRSRFYEAETEFSSEPGIVPVHTLHVIEHLVRLAKPSTEADLGECVLAGLCHSLWVNSTARYGFGRKSMIMALEFFQDCLTERLASALDAHPHVEAMNPYVGKQMMEQPLGLFLHLADTFATYQDTNSQEISTPPSGSPQQVNSQPEKS